ncbi:MAG: hypothetical protein EPN33_14390 [Acidobacteria bacterium]|nr:MAG: hypothetical protein EPN33_14390 [Acidobacteriota bacterium]
MSSRGIDLSVVVFAATIAATFAAALIGRRHSRDIESAALSEHRLNKWLVGLSAGATANSGFVVTAVVGLGYTLGAHWVLLPLAWLLGDIVFWVFFPHRINAAGRSIGAKTITDLITHGLSPRLQQQLTRVIGICVIACLGGYVAAQWLAGQKFLDGAFGISGAAGLAAFAAVIVCYTAIGGFRGSVYVDSMQAVIRIGGTVLALAAVAYVAIHNRTSFAQNLHAAGTSFLQIVPGHAYWAAIPFILGFAAAALGFELGEPQMVSRYLAGATPEETRSAWVIYNFFVQFTWVSMTIFGMLLRGVMPALADPEAGLSVFFRVQTGPILTGIITADVFATIAATSNSLLVAMAQSTASDVFGKLGRRAEENWPITAVLGAATMLVSLQLHGTVFNLALTSVSILGAALAPAMLVRLLGWRSTGASITCSIAVGATSAAAWHALGLSSMMNEAAPGLILALTTNYLISRYWSGSNHGVLAKATSQA